jgi:predicted nuclease with TOPRIM domain
MELKSNELRKGIEIL